VRPAADVVVPFKGSRAALGALQNRLAVLALRPGDTVLVVDNTPDSEPVADEHVIAAPQIPTPAFARNRGAERGRAEWLVFIDADTEPSPDLLDRYFDPPPEPATGLVAGGVVEPEPPRDAAAVVRYSYLRQTASQDDTFAFGEWGYPKSANIAVRREAYEAIGGFREEIRAAEDADLTYRLRAAGWKVERREEAAVVHASRQTVRGFVVQKLVWGAGGAWVNRTYPGAVPLLGRRSFARWALSAFGGGVVNALRKRSRDAFIFAVFRPLEAVAWELGRLLPNERPVRSWRRR